MVEIVLCEAINMLKYNFILISTDSWFCYKIEIYGAK